VVSLVVKPNTYFWWLFTGAACLYLYRLGALAFTTDEIYHGIVARAILETGKPVLPNGSLYLKGVLFSYPGALFSYLFGSIEFGVRFTSALCMLLTGLVVHRLTSELSTQRAGLLASFVWFFHPWTIEFARWGRLYTLAALLFTGAVYFLFRFDASSRRSHLLAACGLLLVATFVYPFCVWGWLVFAVYLSVRAIQNGSLSKRRLIQLSIAALVLGAALIGATTRFADVIGAFTGFTGDHAGFKLERFVGFSDFYAKFFFTDLTVFAVSLVALAARAIIDRGTESGVRRDVVLVMTTLGALLFVSFFHLQDDVPRYLFAVFPLMVVASVCLWGSIIEERLADRSNHAYAALFLLGITGFMLSGSFKIPFKRHGERYENVNFGPTPRRREYSDFKSAAAFVLENASPGDLVIANKYQYFYFYAGREADYELRLSKTTKAGQLSAYMSKTRQIGTCAQLAKIIKGKGSGTTWLSLYDEGNEQKCLRKLFRKQRAELVYQGARDRTAKVYKVTGHRS
jgi:4-amino-4-deoxy-L-arabinose transferase-like glycosyltransferase